MRSRQHHLRRGRGLQDQHRLEQRLSAHGARWVEAFDQAFEGEILVGVSRQTGRARAGEELEKCRVARGVNAQDERVDEEADERLESGLGPASDRGPNRDVGARPDLGQQRRDRGLQEHE